VLKEIGQNKLLWLLVFVPVVFAGKELERDAHTLLFVLSVLAIVPLAVLPSHATESVAAKTGDMVGGLLRHSGNSDRAGHRGRRHARRASILVKASIAGAIVTNALFMICASFLHLKCGQPATPARLRERLKSWDRFWLNGAITLLPDRTG
jgi:Ca2+:H+ antiporter